MRDENALDRSPREVVERLDEPTEVVCRGRGADPKPARGSPEELGDDERLLVLDRERHLSFVDSARREHPDTRRGLAEMGEIVDPTAGAGSSPELCAVARHDSTRAAFVSRRGEKDGDRAGRSAHSGVEPVPCVSIEVVSHKWVDQDEGVGPVVEHATDFLRPIETLPPVRVRLGPVRHPLGELHYATHIQGRNNAVHRQAIGTTGVGGKLPRCPRP